MKPMNRLFVGCVMSRSVSAFSPGLTLRLLLAGCLAGLLAGCADSERLSDPFSNPFQSSAGTDRTPTASVGTNEPVRPVQSRPLSPPVQGTSANRPVAAYTAPSTPSPRFASAGTSGSDVASSVGRSGHGVAGWTAEGGTPIVMAQGETAEIIAKRYGIPPEALLRTNGFASSAQVRPGARLIIPTYNAALAASSGVRFASNRDDRTPARAKLRSVKGPRLADNKHVKSAKAGAKTRIAEAKARSAKPEAEKIAKFEKTGPARAEAIVKPETNVIAQAERPESQPKKVDAAPTSSLVPENSKSIAATDAASPEFRWPARGRIIQAYKAGGNDGINIALPEGTSVKAAEAGVVAYAGNDLKGYGNLVLIRHPNGFVTAYANNGEIDVKRGETVKRGQVIAKSGQSGNVASPQLHFELRKGSTPVDPTQYLAGL